MYKKYSNYKRLVMHMAFLCAITLPAILHGDGQFKMGTGFDYSTGDYGDPSDTDILYVPVNLSYSQGPWKFKTTLPWLQIKGPGTVVGGGDGGVIIGDGSGEVTTESGIGDIWSSVTYSVESIPAEMLYLDLVAKVKLPTADEEKGLGTGETDFTLQVDLFKPLGKLTPLFTLAYKIKGDPDAYELDNVFYVSAGADYRYSDEVNFGATFDFQEASTASSEDRKEIFAYLGQRFGDNGLLTIYGYKGFTDGSADFGGGIQISFSN